MENNILYFDRDSCMSLLDILDIEKKCSSCDIEITRENFGACFGQRKIVSCNSIVCMNELLNESEE